jgi:hypothetical protein
MINMVHLKQGNLNKQGSSIIICPEYEKRLQLVKTASVPQRINVRCSNFCISQVETFQMSVFGNWSSTGICNS